MDASDGARLLIAAFQGLSEVTFTGSSWQSRVNELADAVGSSASGSNRPVSEDGGGT